MTAAMALWSASSKRVSSRDLRHSAPHIGYGYAPPGDRYFAFCHDERLDGATSIEDGRPIVARVTITNPAAEPIGISPGAHLSAEVQLIEERASKTCLLRVHRSIRCDAPPAIDVRAGGKETIPIDLLMDYPVGLIPGRHSVTFVFRNSKGAVARSATSTMNVVTPARSAEYDAFMAACKSLGLNSSQAGAAVLAFARAYPRFPFNPTMLERALLILPTMPDPRSLSFSGKTGCCGGTTRAGQPLRRLRPRAATKRKPTGSGCPAAVGIDHGPRRLPAIRRFPAPLRDKLLCPRCAVQHARRC